MHTVAVLARGVLAVDLLTMAYLLCLLWLYLLMTICIYMHMHIRMHMHITIYADTCVQMHCVPILRYGVLGLTMVR